MMSTGEITDASMRLRPLIAGCLLAIAMPATAASPVADSLPQVNEGELDSYLQMVEGIDVREVRVDGSVLSEAEVASIASSYLRRGVSVVELESLRQALSQAYVAKGYLNSGVVIGDYGRTDGVVVFSEVRGEVSRIDIRGADSLDEGYYRDHLERVTAAPLQIAELQGMLQQLQTHPLIERVNARLQPGVAAGDAVLDVEVTETDAFRYRVGADNYRSPSIGGEQLYFGFDHLSLSGRGDRLSLNLGLANGLTNGSARYNLPIGTHGDSFEFYASTGDSVVVEAPFNLVDIESRTDTLGFLFTMPVLRETDRQIGLSFGVERVATQSTLLGLPFTFSLGDVDGRSRVSTATFGLSWEQRFSDAVLISGLDLRFGLPIFGATVHDPTAPCIIGPGNCNQIPDGKYKAAMFRLQFVQQLAWRDSRLIFSSAMQFTDGPVLAVIKMPVGGRNSVRGHRENLLVRDEAQTASVEWRIPLMQLDSQGGVVRWDPSLQLALFADFGRAKDEDEGIASGMEAAEIYSVGAGLLWQPLPGLSTELYYGIALHELGIEGDDLQDDGVHFGLSYAFSH